MLSKDKTATLLAEFFGTFVLASAVLATVSKLNIPLFVAIAAGSVAGLMVLLIGKVSGAHLNPAVTFGLWSVKKVTTTQTIVYIAAQLLGGLAAWKLGEYFLNQQLPKMAEKNFDWRVVIAEALGAFVFTFGVAAAVSQNFDNAKLAGAVGFSLFVGIVIASLGSSGIVNPAVALGLNSYSLSYIVGPLAGGLLGMNVYQFMFVEAGTTKKSGKKKK